MLTKIRLAFYEMLFELYGKLYECYRTRDNRYKMQECVDRRDDILGVIFTLKGLN